MGQERKNELFVDCPSAVVTYNKSMGGIDLLDRFLSYYRIPVRSKKWYHRLIWQFLDLAVVQAWILYRNDVGVDRNTTMQLKEFKTSIVESLLQQRKSDLTKRGRPSISVEAAHSAKKRRGPAAPIPNKSVRTDGYEHLPEYCQTKGRCRKPGCKGFPKIQCSKCQVRLCFTTSSNCFKTFHES